MIVCQLLINGDFRMKTMMQKVRCSISLLFGWSMFTVTALLWWGVTNK